MTVTQTAAAPEPNEGRSRPRARHPVTAQRSAAARGAGLERKIAEQQEQIRALSEQFAGLCDALEAMARYAGRSLPVPRHLRAVEDARGSGPGAAAVVRHVTFREGS